MKSFKELYAENRSATITRSRQLFNINKGPKMLKSCFSSLEKNNCHFQFHTQMNYYTANWQNRRPDRN